MRHYSAVRARVSYYREGQYPDKDTVLDLKTNTDETSAKGFYIYKGLTRCLR